MRVAGDIGDEPGLHACGLAYLSDDLPTEAVVSLVPRAGTPTGRLEGQFFSASLDHAIYFHRPMAADQWQLQTFTCHGLMSSRGVSVGYVFTEDGTHVATVVQEVLLRKVRRAKAALTAALGSARASRRADTPGPGCQVRTSITSASTSTVTADAPSRSTSKASKVPTSNRWPTET